MLSIDGPAFEYCVVKHHVRDVWSVKLVTVTKSEEMGSFITAFVHLNKDLAALPAYGRGVSTKPLVAVLLVAVLLRYDEPEGSVYGLLIEEMTDLSWRRIGLLEISRATEHTQRLTAVLEQDHTRKNLLPQELIDRLPRRKFLLG